MKKIWECKIGEIDASRLPPNADEPMRAAVQRAYFELTGTRADFIFSGWGGELTGSERRVLDSRPSETYIAGTMGAPGSGEKS